MKKLSFSLIIASLISGVSQVKAMNSLNDNTIEAYTREGLTWLAKKSSVNQRILVNFNIMNAAHYQIRSI